MEKSVGEKLKECRTERQWSQQELAEQLHVTRQAVSNWERDKTLPDVYMIKEIAAVFDMTLDEYMENTRQAEVKMPKLPGRLTAATAAVIFLYLIIGAITGKIMVDLVVGMAVISIFCQMFVHLYLSGAVKSGNFSMLAGYDSKVEYRVEEVKKVLIQMDVHNSCSAFGAVLLLGLCGFLEQELGGTVCVCVILSYCIDLTLAICFINYRNIERTMVREKDQKTAKAGYLSLCWYLGWIFAWIGATFAKFELKSIENNSQEAVGYLVWIFLFLLIATAELFYEQHRAKKEVEAERKYKAGKAFWISSLLEAGLMLGMLFY
ncbi:MAG: helix-turn-helix transcriptional regulator [Lachnospiraceae bacterium]|nr:helix-turn-helix transcriptional regulator [Lachnospiraceae bacterium]